MSWLGRSFFALRWLAALLAAGALVLLLRELRAFPSAKTYIDEVANAYGKQIDAAHEQREYAQSAQCAQDARDELASAEKLARDTNTVAELMRAQAEAAAAHAATFQAERWPAPWRAPVAVAQSGSICFVRGGENMPPRIDCQPINRPNQILFVIPPKGEVLVVPYHVLARRGQNGWGYSWGYIYQEYEQKLHLTANLKRKAAHEANLVATQVRTTLEKHRVEAQRLTESASDAGRLAEEKRGAAVIAGDIAQSVVESVRQAVVVAESARQRIALFWTLAMVSALLSGLLTVLFIVFGSGEPDSFKSRVRECARILRQGRPWYEGVAIPGHGFRALSAFLYSSHKAERVFGQVLADMQRDFCAAIDARRYADARAARWRGYADFFRTMAAQLVEDLLGWVIHLFWRIG